MCVAAGAAGGDGGHHGAQLAVRGRVPGRVPDQRHVRHQDLDGDRVRTCNIHLHFTVLAYLSCLTSDYIVVFASDNSP